MNKQDYKILIKEKFKVLPLFIIYLLVLFFFNYLNYDKTRYASDILIDENPNIEFINNFHLSYKNIFNNYQQGIMGQYFRSLFQNLYSEIINNYDVTKVALNRIKENYNLDFNLDNIGPQIQYNKKNYQYIGPKNHHDGKQYLEISIDKKSFKKLNFDNSVIYQDFVNELLMEANKNIFMIFNNTILESTKSRFDLQIKNKEILNVKNKFNLELNNIISKLENEKFYLLENTKLEKKYFFNNSINLEEVLTNLILEESNEVNANEIDINLIYLYLLLDELKSIKEYDLDNNSTNDVFMVKENFTDIYKNLHSKYNSISFSLYRLSKLNYLIHLHYKVSSLISDKNINKEILINNYCSENCYLNYTITKKNKRNFYKNFSNFYIINILTLSFFFFLTFITIKIIIFYYKIKNQII